MPSPEQQSGSCSKGTDATSAHKHLPLNFVTWPEYHALLAATNPAVQEFLTDSGITLAGDLTKAYDAHRESVKKWLERARSLVHISMDIWSSPQRKTYIAIHAQLVDETCKPLKTLLGLPNLRRAHAGAAMTPHLMKIIRQYRLAHRIGYFTGDNDAKNDACLRQLAVELSREYDVTIDPVSSRTRCAGHIIILSLQAFLLATSEHALQAAIEAAQDEANGVTATNALHVQLRELLSELAELSNVLQELSQAPRGNVDVDLSALKITLDQCSRACEEFEGELIACSSWSSQDRTSFRDWAKLTYRGGDGIEGFRQQLIGYKSTIVVVLGLTNLCTSTITVEAMQSCRGLMETTTIDLEAHLEDVKQKLDVLASRALASPEANEATVKYIENERLSTEKFQYATEEADAPGLLGPHPTSNMLIGEGLNGSKEYLGFALERLKRHRQKVSGRIDASSPTAISSDK
ncbi:hypothetical protein ACKAV7_000006 [Fusarium commune]